MLLVAALSVAEFESVSLLDGNRLQSRAEFWMIAVHDAASFRFSHRDAGADPGAR